MPNLANFFAAGPDAAEHPKLRYWMGKKKAGGAVDARVEVRRLRHGLVSLPVKLYFSLYAGDRSEVFQDEADWDDELNQGLVTHGVRARDLENEKVRFGLSLDGGFRRAERQFGDGYFNSVLIHLLRTTPLGEDPNVAQILKEIRENRPSMDGPSYALCKERLTTTLEQRWEELSGHLKYPTEEASEVLAGALVVYLDDRFNVSNRRLLFGR